jgi:hypothetical protein
MKLGCILLVFAVPAFAQEQEAQRALMQRDQQSAEFALQLRQSQETPSPHHLVERHRLENLSSQQLLQVGKDTPQELRPYERQKSADERVLLFAPPVVRARLPQEPLPLPAQMPEAASPVGPAY